MNSTQPLFLVVEDHPNTAQGNCNWLQNLEANCRCETAETPEQALERLNLQTPDLIVVDLIFRTKDGGESGKQGLWLLEQIFEDYPNLNILVYSSHPKLLMPLVSSIEKYKGGFAVVDKLETRSEFLEKARSALNQELRIPKELRSVMSLTEVESKLLRLMCMEYLTDQAIAEREYCSIRTAQKGIQRIKEKLGVSSRDKDNTNSRVAACMIAVEKRLLTF